MIIAITLKDRNLINHNNSKIAQKAAHGVFWNFVAYGATKGFVLVTISILARILSKDDFGIVAIAMVAVNYLSIVKDLGLGVALIQRRGDIKEAAETVFTLNLILGIALSLIMLPVALLVASYFNNPAVTSVVRWLGVSFFINSIGSVHIVLLKRELDFRRKLIPDLGNALVKGIASIALALAGYGVWSLVFGQLLGALISSILVWVVVPFRPRLTINYLLAKDLIKFGVSVTGTDALSIVTESLPAVIIGRVSGLAILSIYTLAYRLPEMLIINSLWVLGGVAFPAFSTIQEHPEQLRKGFLATVRLISIITVPICFGMLVAADPIINVLFGDQWLEAIPVLQVLAIVGWVYSIGFHVGGVYKAIGRPDILFKLSMLALGITLPALLIGTQYGLVGVAIGQLISVIIVRVVGLTLATRFVGVSYKDILGEMLPALKGGIILIGLTIPLMLITQDVSPFIRLIMVIAAGASGYLGTLWLVEREYLLRFVKLLGIDK